MSSEFIRYIKSQLTKESPIPLYEQILNILRAYAATGDFAVGSRLPSESELMAELSVSRVTVRQAMDEAVKEGLIIRRAGKGTFLATTLSEAPVPGFVGYVVHHLSSSFNVQMMLGADSVMKAAGYHLIFSNSESDLDIEDHLLQDLCRQAVMGFIIQPVYSEKSNRMLSKLVRQSIPVVLLDREVPDLDVDVISSDHYDGGKKAVQHLIQQGYKDIVYLGRNPLKLSSVSERLRGYEQAMQEAGLISRPPFVVGGSVEIGYNQLRNSMNVNEDGIIDSIIEFLRGPDCPEAIVSMSDGFATLVIKAANKMNLRIPQDLALVGFDNMDFTASLGLTTVNQPSFQIGAEAARLLIRRIQGDKQEKQRIQLPVDLIVRESSIHF